MVDASCGCAHPPRPGLHSGFPFLIPTRRVADQHHRQPEEKHKQRRQRRQCQLGAIVGLPRPFAKKFTDRQDDGLQPRVYPANNDPSLGRSGWGRRSYPGGLELDVHRLLLPPMGMERSGAPHFFSSFHSLMGRSAVLQSRQQGNLGYCSLQKFSQRQHFRALHVVSRVLPARSSPSLTMANRLYYLWLADLARTFGARTRGSTMLGRRLIKVSDPTEQRARSTRGLDCGSGYY